MASRNLFLEGYLIASFNRTSTLFTVDSEQVGDVEVGRFLGYGAQFEGAMELSHGLYLYVISGASLAPIFAEAQRQETLLNPTLHAALSLLWKI